MEIIRIKDRITVFPKELLLDFMKSKKMREGVDYILTPYLTVKEAHTISPKNWREVQKKEGSVIIPLTPKAKELCNEVTLLCRAYSPWERSCQDGCPEPNKGDIFPWCFEGEIYYDN